MEQPPHLLVEGMLISAFALKAYRGYIFLARRIYRSGGSESVVPLPKPPKRVCLAKNIMGTGFDFELFVHTGQGATSAVKKQR